MLFDYYRYYSRQETLNIVSSKIIQYKTIKNTRITDFI